MSIPVHINVGRAVSRSERYVGDLTQQQLRRLADFSPVRLHADLAVEPGDVGLGRLNGQVEGELQLQCQACLAHYTWSPDLTIDLVIVGSEDEESRLMRDCEPLLVQDDRLMLQELVEDEVLLALPLLRRCPTCENRQVAAVEVDEPDTSRPLAALKNLKLKS